MSWRNPCRPVEPLEISTYVSQDMEGVRYAAQSFSGARLVLLTRHRDQRRYTAGHARGQPAPSTPPFGITTWRWCARRKPARLELLKALASAASGLAALLKPPA